MIGSGAGSSGSLLPIIVCARYGYVRLCPWENVPLQDGKKGFQLLPGGVPAEGNPERPVDHLRGSMHGGKNMAAVTLGAGASGGDADAGVL